MAITTKKEFALELGLSTRSLSRHFLRDDWPVPIKPKWTEAHVNVVKQYLEDLQENRSPSEPNKGPGPRTIADVRLRIERAKKVKIEREHLEGKLMHINDIRREIQGAMSELRNTLMNVPRKLGKCPKGIKDKVDNEIRTALRDVADRMKRAVANQES